MEDILQSFDFIDNTYRKYIKKLELNYGENSFNLFLNDVVLFMYNQRSDYKLKKSLNVTYSYHINKKRNLNTFSLRTHSLGKIIPNVITCKMRTNVIEETKYTADSSSSLWFFTELIKFTDYYNL